MKLQYCCLLATLIAAPSIVCAQGDPSQVAQVKEAMQQNQAALRAYTWQEHMQIFLKGDMKSQQDYSVVTGPDGKPQKTPMDPPPPPPSGRRVKRAIVEKKTSELKDYMAQAKQLIEQYVPPSGQKLQEAFASGNVSIANVGPGMLQLTVKNYVQSGDSMALTFDANARKLAALSVNSYLGQEKDAVTLSVNFAPLPDGTNHVVNMDLIAKAKNIEVRSMNDNYRHM
jgi:hypothetical protein